MNALNFYRYLRSYITVNISGGFIERFINLCNKNKIKMWDVVFSDEAVTAKMYCKDFSSLRPLCKKSGVTVKIISKSGLNFDLKKHRERRGLLVGIVFAAVFTVAMNMFVWEIETVGSDKLSRYEILSTVKNAGLDYGTFTPLFNANESSRNALNMFNGKVLWLSINIKGSKATVEVRDFERVDDKDIKSVPSNLIANFDGTLVQAQTNSGVQIANAGETVTEGDMLISGVFENEDGTVMYQASDGCFTALNKQTLTNSFNRDISIDTLTFEQRSKSLILFHLNIPLNIKINNSVTKQSYINYSSYNGKILPFGITEISSYETQPQKIKAADNLIFIDKFTNEEYEKMKNTLIIDTAYSLTETGKTLDISCNYTCIDYIGKKVPIISENVNF